MSMEQAVVAAIAAAVAAAAVSATATATAASPPSPPPAVGTLEGLLDVVIGVLSGEDCSALRAGLRLRGYVVVGSTALIGACSDGDGDLDAVLLSEGAASAGGYDGGSALWQVHTALRAAAEMAGCDVHFVSATVPLVKVSRAEASLDLLWLAGVVLPPPSTTEPDGAPSDDDPHTEMVIETLAEAAGDEPEPPAYAPPPPLVRYEAADERVQLPATGTGGAADAVRLSRLLGRTLSAGSPSFTVETITRLRGWAKARHLYGSRYGYPGGSAWTVPGADPRDRSDARVGPAIRCSGSTASTSTW